MQPVGKPGDKLLRNGVDEMKTESVVIHKGGKEEKYKICVEDYVISYLKYETGTLELSEIFFYGYREKNEKEYIIYGAGRDKHLTIFDKYDLLDKITCRLTQGGPVFMVREKDKLYEVKGYDIFYYKNEEMQNYLIDRKQQNRTAEKTEEETAEYMPLKKRKTESAEYTPSGKQNAKTVEMPGKHLHNTMSLQLGIIFVILIAIVINSTNSYDKMKQLNQSAQEVFFAIENQEAEETASADGTQEELTVEREISPENVDGEIANLTFIEIGETAANEPQQQEEEKEAEGILKPAADEINEATAEEAEHAQAEESTAKEDAAQPAQAEADSGEEEPQGTEALSRSVTRYYEIERGDTLYTISEEIYGDTSKVKEICELNQISDPDNIRYGQKIILP